MLHFDCAQGKGGCRDAARIQAPKSTSAPPHAVSVITITLKSLEEAKAPDDSKINQHKPMISLTCLYAN